MYIVNLVISTDAGQADAVFVCVQRSARVISSRMHNGGRTPNSSILEPAGYKKDRIQPAPVFDPEIGK